MSGKEQKGCGFEVGKGSVLEDASSTCQWTGTGTIASHIRFLDMPRFIL